MKDVREEYHADGLTEADLHDDPLAQAQRWVDEAIDAGLPLPNAMTLATVSADGQPSTRVVLLKGIEGGGFTFFTHYDSRKGREIEGNARVSFTMFWQPFDRQMIVIGEAHKVDEEESQAYFASRPYGSQVSAAISPQSQPVTREWLEAQVEALQQQHPQAPVPKPAQWGGYRIVPTEIQFWHGRPSRLHDRFRYFKQADGRWHRERLAP
ncbi:pyridoxamine-phosphate oxidase [Alcanivorax hongdengensis A-11-3]|uniref:Pyridoxine/pyridoxamine 5'-phosphate oxidase n=1 Tax=Alcanivorax hongdengensis A-11-3 TaxID=1177179 RepID=L0WGB1_9GAMM|nr:pyridoxamine 5'-phosphate oxidase [Alcanivorax hongdengensis]EKF76051.1 pyridoxamine-phosphate oxidase [Alcanivorax hongdengensis A-11-3]